VKIAKEFAHVVLTHNVILELVNVFVHLDLQEAIALKVSSFWYFYWNSIAVA